MASSWKTLSSKNVYKSKWISLREDSVIQPNGEESTFCVVEGKVYIMMIPKIGNEFYLVEQYRYPVQAFSIEFPAGGVKSGETIESTIKRELVEETGLEPKKMKKIGELYVSSSFSNIVFHTYIVEDFVQKSVSPEPAEGKIKLMMVSEEQIKEYIRTGKITDSQTIAAFQLYQQYRSL